MRKQLYEKRNRPYLTNLLANSVVSYSIIFSTEMNDGSMEIRGGN